MKQYEEYIMEKELIFLYENKEVILTEDNVDPEVIRWAKQIADKLNIHFDGFLDNTVDLMPSEYKNTAFFKDPESNRTFVVQLNNFFNGIKTAFNNLTNIRISKNLPVPVKPNEVY